MTSAQTHQNAVAVIDTRRNVLAEEITRQCYDARRDLVQRYGPAGREKCLQDTLYHLSYLVEAIGHESPALFVDYVGWAKVLLASVRVPVRDLEWNLEVMRETLHRLLPQEVQAVAVDYVQTGMDALAGMPSELPTFLAPDHPRSALAREYLQLLLEGQRHLASRKILDAVQSGISIKEIYRGVFEPVQHEIGRLWQTNRISVAQEHYCTAATQLVMSQLYPQMFGREKNGRRMMATCIGSELHEIGLRMIADFFEMDGWETFYLGANVPSTSILRTLRERHAHVLAISVTMTFHVRALSDLIRAVRSVPELAPVKIIVGGYPFKIEPELWKRVGADGFAASADDAVALAESLVHSPASA